MYEERQWVTLLHHPETWLVKRCGHSESVLPIYVDHVHSAGPVPCMWMNKAANLKPFNLGEDALFLLIKLTWMPPSLPTFRIDQKVSNSPYGYKLQEAQAILSEVRSIRDAISSGEKEKQELMQVNLFFSCKKQILKIKLFQHNILDMAHCGAILLTLCHLKHLKVLCQAWENYLEDVIVKQSGLRRL